MYGYLNRKKAGMQALNTFLKGTGRLLWWPAVVGAIFVIGSAVLGIVTSLPSKDTKLKLFGSPEYFHDRWNRGFYFAASVRNAVVLVRALGTDNMQLLLVDFDTGKKIRLGSERSHLLSPYLSQDGTRLMFTRQLLGREGHELISCETISFTCRTMMRSNGAIQSPIEISGHRVLYVSSPWRRPDGQVRFSSNDIWLLDPATGSRQLTDFQLYQLYSLSVSDNSIYFSGVGPRPEKPIIPKYEPDLNAQSDIFRLPFDHETGTLEAPPEMMTPLFAGSGIATRPSTSANGLLVAFLRTRTGISPYHYNLVIADRNEHTERLIETSGLGFSQPVVIGGDVYAAVTKDDRVLIQMVRPGEPDMKLLADITDASAAAAETIELKIEP
ncbi:Tol biopolymer transport system component [Nitrobacteraceae bacterium AZCC 2146]